MKPISWWKTDLIYGEAESAAAAIQSCHISQGPLTAELEQNIKDRVGARHAIAVPSGSQGLLLTMLALDIGPGDEVIVPDMTWIATAHAARLLGATIKLVDCLPNLPLLDPSCLEATITPRTRAIIAVHLAGRSVDMDHVLEISDRHNIPVVEDAAQALCSRSNGKALGTLGTMGVYSLGLAKLISCGQGGVVVCNDDKLSETIRLCTRHGTQNIPADQYLGLGMNMKFPDILAAVALRQWDRADQKVDHVTNVYKRYRDGLKGHNMLDVLACDLDNGEVPLWTEIRTTHREHVIAHLAKHSIESRLAHTPLHTAEHLYDTSKNADELFPNTTALAQELLILPSGPDQPLDSVDHVIDVLLGMEPIE